MRKTYESLISLTERIFRIDARYFINGGFWLSFSQVATVSFGLLTTVLLAHYLSESNYGIYKYLITLATIFGLFSLSGVRQAIIQTAAKGYKNFYRESVPFIFKVNLLIGAVSIATAGYYWYNENTLLSIGCLLIAIIQPLSQTFQSTPAYLNGRRQFKLNTNVNISKTLFIAVTTLVTLFFTQNILWLFFSYLGSHLLAHLVMYTLFIHPAERTPPDITQKYLNYAKHTSWRNIIMGIAGKADTLIVFTRLGAVEMAIYSIATVIPEQIKASLVNLTTLLLPKYAQHSDIGTLRRSVPKRSIQLFLVITVITIIYILMTPLIYGILFPKYHDAVLYSQLAALAFPTFILYIPYSILQTQLEEHILYRITLYTSLFQIVSVLLLVFSFGLLGAIIARIAHRIILLITTYWYLYKIN